MTPADILAALDARIERYQIAREVLAELGAPVLLGPAAPTAAKPRALPAGKADAPAGRGEPHRSALVPLMLRELAARPLPCAELARLIGANVHTVGDHLEGKTALFRRVPGNRRSPWELTDAGRKAAAALFPGA